MPAQQTAGKTVFYAEGDTAPDLSVILEDGDGNPVDLTGATVVINIAHSRWSFYYSPSEKIVTNGACDVDPDQTSFALSSL